VPEELGGEKTEPATPRKRSEARKKGQVARSKEINTALILIFGLLSLYLTGQWMFNALGGLVVKLIGQAGETALSPESVQRTMMSAAFTALRGVGPMLCTVFLVALLASYGQVGFLFAADPITPKLERVDPAKGLKRMFSIRSVANLGVSLGKLAIIGGVAYVFIAFQLDRFAAMVDQTTGQIFVGLCKAMFQLMFFIALALVLLAVLDYGYQWWQHEKDLKMSRRELMDELKRTEGDPQVKARVRQIQRDVARRRMLSKVPEADVVVTNPTHYAVALQYAAEKMSAPTVLAKGRNLLAKRIIQLARSEGVPVVENPPLAQSLYKAVEVGDQVPPALYRAVAQVLANLYRLRQAARASRVT